MEDYKTRFINEYNELKERYCKLNKILVKEEADTLDFQLTCPIYLLKAQLEVMRTYLHILEVRAELEEVDLEKKEK